MKLRIAVTTATVAILTAVAALFIAPSANAATEFCGPADLLSDNTISTGLYPPTKLTFKRASGQLVTVSATSTEATYWTGRNAQLVQVCVSL